MTVEDWCDGMLAHRKEHKEKYQSLSKCTMCGDLVGFWKGNDEKCSFMIERGVGFHAVLLFLNKKNSSVATFTSESRIAIITNSSLYGNLLGLTSLVLSYFKWEILISM